MKFKFAFSNDAVTNQVTRKLLAESGKLYPVLGYTKWSKKKGSAIVINLHHCHDRRKGKTEYNVCWAIIHETLHAAIRSEVPYLPDGEEDIIHALAKESMVGKRC